MANFDPLCNYDHPPVGFQRLLLREAAQRRVAFCGQSRHDRMTVQLLHGHGNRQLYKVERITTPQSSQKASLCRGRAAFSYGNWHRARPRISPRDSTSFRSVITKGILDENSGLAQGQPTIEVAPALFFFWDTFIDENLKQDSRNSFQLRKPSGNHPSVRGGAGSLGYHDNGFFERTMPCAITTGL